MPTLAQIQSGSRRVKVQGGRVLAGGAGAVVIVLSIIFGLEVSAAALRATPESSEQTSGQVVIARERATARLVCKKFEDPDLHRLPI